MRRDEEPEDWRRSIPMLAMALLEVLGSLSSINKAKKVTRRTPRCPAAISDPSRMPEMMPAQWMNAIFRTITDAFFTFNFCAERQRLLDPRHEMCSQRGLAVEDWVEQGAEPAQQTRKWRRQRDAPGADASRREDLLDLASAERLVRQDCEGC